MKETLNFIGQVLFGDAVGMQKPVYVIIYVLLFASIFFLAKFAYTSASKNGVFTSTRGKIKDSISLSYVRRQEAEDAEWEKDGEREKKPFMYNFDRLIDFCGLRNAIPSVSAEMFIILFVLIIALSVFLSVFSGLGAFLGMIIGVGICFLIRAIMRAVADINYNSVENGMFSFINAVATEAKSSDDIISVLDKAKTTLCRPLRVAMRNCVVEARSTGRVMEALRHFELAVENKEMKKIIRNLAMCTQTDSDYFSVMEHCRLGIKEHVNAREERKAIANNAKVTTIQLLVISAISLVLVGNICDTSNVFLYLWSFFSGKVVLVFILVVMFFCLIDFFVIGERE